MARDKQLNPIDRVIFFAVGLVLVGAALTLAVSALGWQGSGSIVALVLWVQTRPIEAIVAAAVLLLGGLHSFYFASQTERDEGLRQETPMGHVQVSMRAVENLVTRSAREVEGINEVDAKVHQGPDGIALSLALVVQPDVQIPRVSDEVTALVQARIKETVGIDVGRVNVEVRNIAGTARQRRE